MREIQEMEAIRFAASLGVFLVAVGLDLLRVYRKFPSSRPGARENRFLVVADQRNQASQAGGVAVPGNRNVQAARIVNPRAVIVDRVE